jgi:hypothetical protein
MPVQHLGEWISEHLSGIENIAKAIGSGRLDPSLLEDLIQSGAADCEGRKEPWTGRCSS